MMTTRAEVVMVPSGAVQPSSNGSQLSDVKKPGSHQTSLHTQRDGAVSLVPPDPYPQPTSLPDDRSSSSSSGRTRRPSDATSTSTSVTENGGVSTKRQTEFEKYFAEKLRASAGPDADLRVISTKAADLQRKLLIHGRLYLTRSHLCFRSNILGYTTENVHALKDVVSVEKGTTAGVIQNAINVTMVGDEHYDYGSLSDRDGLYDDLLGCWKLELPEKDEAQLGDSSIPPSTLTKRTNLDSVGAGEAGAGDVRHTECSGEHFDEVAMDTKFPLSPTQLFELIYHNPAFRTEFYEKDEGLTDVDVSEWSTGEGGQRRTLSHVMHMNNPIGPSQSDCIGSEHVVVADPDVAYEIFSETQTPDVPSGKKQASIEGFPFKIRTRTCLTHTDLHGRPATRMYCTTQTDWSSSSLLKSTITPAVIKGQKSYHQRLTRKIREWVRSHPEDFGIESNPGAEVDEGEAEDIEEKTMGDGTDNKRNLSVHVGKLWDNPVTTGPLVLITLLVILLIAQQLPWT